MSEPNDKYCNKCGEELSSYEREAQNVKIFHYDSQGGSMQRLDSAFDSGTGERNYTSIFECPNWKKWWFGSNDHMQFCFYQGRTYHIISFR